MEDMYPSIYFEWETMTNPCNSVIIGSRYNTSWWGCHHALKLGYIWGMACHSPTHYLIDSSSDLSVTQEVLACGNLLGDLMPSGNLQKRHVVTDSHWHCCVPTREKNQDLLCGFSLAWQLSRYVNQLCGGCGGCDNAVNFRNMMDASITVSPNTAATSSRALEVAMLAAEIRLPNKLWRTIVDSSGKSKIYLNILNVYLSCLLPIK